MVNTKHAYRVHELLRWYCDVDDSKVLLEPVTHKHTPNVHKVPTHKHTRARTHTKTNAFTPTRGAYCLLRVPAELAQ